MSEMTREQYRAMLADKKEAAGALASSLADFLTVEIDAEIEMMDAEPEADPLEVQRLTEDLMIANERVALAERNLEIFRQTCTNLPPEVLEVIRPWWPVLTEVVIPLVNGYIESSVLKATRRRDDIQADLMELEPADKAEPQQGEEAPERI